MDNFIEDLIKTLSYRNHFKSQLLIKSALKTENEAYKVLRQRQEEIIYCK